MIKNRNRSKDHYHVIFFLIVSLFPCLVSLSQQLYTLDLLYNEQLAARTSAITVVKLFRVSSRNISDSKLSFQSEAEYSVSNIPLRTKKHSLKLLISVYPFSSILPSHTFIQTPQPRLPLAPPPVPLTYKAQPNILVFIRFSQVILR